MAEKLKELIQKINEEGVKKAEDRAKAIELEAKKTSERIVKDAKEDVRKIVEEAEKSAKKTKETAERALKQASRDLMLSLKDEIRKIFDKIVAAETRKSMSQDEMREILGKVIGNYINKGGKSSDIKVLLGKDDLDDLKKTFIARLKEKLKDGIEFKPSPNISAGFSISFDKGKSFFDFTDEGLAGALCAYLNPELAKLLK
jgi:V/A-type H+-transporting ATPase subunit E